MAEKKEPWKLESETIASLAELADIATHTEVIPNMGPQVAAAIDATRDVIKYGPDYIAGAIRAHDQEIKDKADQLHEQELKNRVEEGTKLYKDEQAAVAEAQKKEEFQKASFEEQAKMLKAEFDKSTQNQLEFKKDQDLRAKFFAEDAIVAKQLQGLHEQARDAHGKWRQSEAQDLCSKEAVLQINHQIDQQVGAYKDRLEKRDMAVPPDSLLLKEYKVRLEGTMMTPEALAQKTNELQEKHFGDSLKPPDIAPPGGGPGGGEPGGSSPPNNNEAEKEKFRQRLGQRNGQLSSDEIEKKVQDYAETLEKHDMAAPPNSMMLEERRQELSSGPDRNDK